VEVETKSEREKLMFRLKVKIDPDLLKKSEQQGRLIQVAEASDQNLDVKIIPMN
jgi:hypothetical protein